MPGAILQGTRLHATHCFPYKFVWPSAGATGGLIGPVKHDQNMVFSGFLKKGFVEIDHVLGFMIEEINLRPGNTKVVQHLEKRFSSEEHTSELQSRFDLVC